MIRACGDRAQRKPYFAQERRSKNLQSVIIPKFVTDIYQHAFDGCANLTSVYYQGAESEWLKVQIDPSGNAALENATKYYEEKYTIFCDLENNKNDLPSGRSFFSFVIRQSCST